MRWSWKSLLIRAGQFGSFFPVQLQGTGYPVGDVGRRIFGAEIRWADAAGVLPVEFFPCGDGGIVICRKISVHVVLYIILLNLYFYLSHCSASCCEIWVTLVGIYSISPFGEKTGGSQPGRLWPLVWEHRERILFLIPPVPGQGAVWKIPGRKEKAAWKRTVESG